MSCAAYRRYGHPVTTLEAVGDLTSTGRQCDVMGPCSDAGCRTCWRFSRFVLVSMWTLGGLDPIGRNARRRAQRWHHLRTKLYGGAESAIVARLRARPWTCIGSRSYLPYQLKSTNSRI